MTACERCGRKIKSNQQDSDLIVQTDDLCQKCKRIKNDS